MSVKSSLPIVELEADGFGMSKTSTVTNPQVQDDPNDPSTATYKFPIKIEHAARLDVSTTSAAGDLDLYLLYDANADGEFDFNSEVIGSSTTSSANEFVTVSMPDDGDYLAAVQGWAAANTTFDTTIKTVQGHDLMVTDLPNGPYQPNTPINFTVVWKLDAPLAAGASTEGLILAGPNGAPAALQIPVRLHNKTTATETVEIPAVEDSFLQKGAPNLNFGSAPLLYVAGSDNLRSVLKFDTGAINSTYPVQSAKLFVYMDGYGSTGNQHTLEAWGLTTAWSEATATWKTPWSTPGGDVDTKVGATPISKTQVGQWVEVDVTSLAQQWVTSPAANKGVILRATEGVSFATFRFGSSEYWGPQKPFLKVTYGVP